VEKYGTVRQATDDNIIRRTRFACRITKATHTHSRYVKHCFSTATMVTRTRLNVTFIPTLLCLSCSFSCSIKEISGELPLRGYKSFVLHSFSFTNIPTTRKYTETHTTCTILFSSANTEKDTPCKNNTNYHSTDFINLVSD
jgi:hypothetical protein